MRHTNRTMPHNTLAGLKTRARNTPPNILAVEGAVVDLQYDGARGDDALKHGFFSHLKELIAESGGQVMFDENPRPGDMALVMAEDFDDALIGFAQHHGLQPTEPHVMDRTAMAATIRSHVFGDPVATAGGSLANTFHALVRAQIDGINMVNGHFVTALGTCPSGRVFHDSMQGNIHAVTGGRQMECHVFPIDGDRILIATPSKKDPAEGRISSALFADEAGALHARDRIMLGGFLFFTAGFHDVFDAVAAHVRARPDHDRPTVVITAAAQTIAAHDTFREKVRSFYGASPLVIHANTGEFRRLFDLDTDWRGPFEADFAGLRGRALDAAKNQHVAYKAAKDKANIVALTAAQAHAARVQRETGHKTRFVVTNGGREIFVVSPEGFQTYTPNKIAREQIVNTVGAGDNFAAGFQLGDIFNLDHSHSARIGADFATAIIQSADARLDPKAVKVVPVSTRSTVTLGGALAHLQDQTIRLLAPGI